MSNSSQSDLVADLTTLNQIIETLNQAVDVRAVLNSTLARLVELMGLETGWIFLADPAAQDRWAGSGYVLAAHHNLPPALALDSADAWDGGCDCQALCNAGRLTEAYNEVRCIRLARARGDRRGLAVHASVPLRSGDRPLGILNVAGPDWASFSQRALTLLSNAGSQMGLALERARLYDLLRERRIDEQAALLDLSNQLLARLDLDDLIDYLVEAVRRLLQADACALLLPDDEPGSLAFRAANGWRQDPVAAGYRVPSDERSGPGQAMQAQRPVLIDDILGGDLALWCPQWLHAEDFRGQAVVPLIAAGRSIGALLIDVRQPHGWAEDEVRFMRLMANQAAIAIVKARLHQEEVRQQRLY
jgi:GAF domain-containing protein